MDSSEKIVSGNGVPNDPTPAAYLFLNTLKIFRDYISAVDGDRCPMHPTCSAYSIQAVKKHGFLAGYIMTVDRLLRESNEMDTAQVEVIGDKLRFLDPVEANDFWWHENRSSY